MAELAEKACLNHTISLSHLLTEATDDAPWQKFEILGLSDRDNQVYLLALSESAIGVFTGSPLIPNSWTLKHKFYPAGMEKIKIGQRFSACHFCKTFSYDFNQIGFVVTVSTEEDIGNDVIFHHIFAILDLTTSQWQQRMFTWPDGLPFYQMSHTSAGWLGFIGNDMTIYRLSINPPQPCVLYITRPPQQVDPNEYYDDLFSYMFTSKDSIYLFPIYFREDHERQRFMVACHLEQEGLPWVRYNFGTTVHQGNSTNGGLQPISWGSLPLIKTDLCQCNGPTPLQGNCTDCQERSSDPSFGLLSLQKVHTFELDPATKHCHFRKYGQFLDIPSLVDGSAHMLDLDLVKSVAMTKSKFLSLIHSECEMFLHTASFRNVPSLKELSSMVVIKSLCNKSQQQFKGIPLSAWFDGPNEQMKRDLGINAVRDFGKINP